MGIFCMTQGTQRVALWLSRRVGWWGRWEEGPRGRGHGCTYGWFLWTYDRKSENSVKQLILNLKSKQSEKKNPTNIQVKFWLIWSKMARGLWKFFFKFLRRPVLRIKFILPDTFSIHYLDRNSLNICLFI